MTLGLFGEAFLSGHKVLKKENANHQSEFADDWKIHYFPQRELLEKKIKILVDEKGSEVNNRVEMNRCYKC